MRFWGARPVHGPFGCSLYPGSIKPGQSRDWYLRAFDYFTSYLGAIQAEMNRRGGLPFIHLTFALHQLAEGDNTTVNGPHAETHGGIWQQ